MGRPPTNPTPIHPIETHVTSPPSPPPSTQSIAPPQNYAHCGSDSGLIRSNEADSGVTADSNMYIGPMRISNYGSMQTDESMFVLEHGDA